MQDSIWSQEIQYNSWTPTKSLSIPWLHILRGTNVLFNQINVQTKTSKWTAVFMLLTYKQVHTYMYVYINESPRVCTSSLAPPQGAPQPTDAGASATRPSNWDDANIWGLSQKHTAMHFYSEHKECFDHDWIWTCKETESPVTLQWAESVAWAQSPHFERVWFLPMLLKLCSQHSCPPHQYHFITWQCNWKIHWLVSKAKPVSDTEKVT